MSKGLYIHVPFCRRKCPYCDFYSVTDTSLTESYVQAVIRNIRAQKESYDTVYFGGGTPSLLTKRQIYDILSSADIADNAEISAECNPDSADREKLEGFRQAGINRISVGIQSLDDGDLHCLGRLHSAAQAEAAINNARLAGFDNISADLMLGTPYQSKDTIISNIERLSELGVDHISAYILKIEENTALSRSSELTAACADSDTMADYYEAAVFALREHGYFQYEISNFAKKGFECRHNLKYWRCEDYFGVGPAAHSCIDGKRFAVPKDIRSFMSNERQEEIITDEFSCGDEERMMLALRLTEGYKIPEGETGSSLISAAKPLEAHGLLNIENGRIILTPKGFLVSNSIICRLSEALEEG